MATPLGETRPNPDQAAILVDIPDDIDTDYNNQGQKRCWFITDEFRARVSTVQMMNGVYLMAYCSERRCVSPEDLSTMVEQNAARAALNLAQLH